MKYLKKFETEADVMMMVQPNVVLVSDENRILYNVEPPKGIFIQHIDGGLYTIDQWTAMGFEESKANGVAVIDTDVRFIVAKGNVGSFPWSSDTETFVEGVGSGSGDYNGKTNTELMLATDTSGAAYSCINYTFPNGQKGYLPSSGELKYCWNNRTALKDALILIGGEVLDNNYDYWSSSQYNATNAWYINFYSGINDYKKKSSKCRARPFTTL